METIETKPAATLRDFLAALKRRRKSVILTAIACVATAVALASLLPAYYRSTGTILIEQQEVPQDLVRSTVTSYADQRIQVISQRVMTTQNLLDIISRYDLYPRERRRDAREKLIERMRGDVALKMISADVIDPRSGMPRAATIAFTVSYTSRSADKAVKVANELNTLFLNENLTERSRLARDTAGFLEDQAVRLSTRVAELEARLAEFKTKNLEALPELQGLNMQLLDRNEQELHQLEARMMALDQQRVFLQAQLAQLKPNSFMTGDGGERILSSADRLKVLKSKLASARAVYAPTHPDIERMEREVRGLEAEVGGDASTLGATNELLRELENVRGALAQARERYASDHPDVQRLERRVAALETQLKGAGASATATAAMSAAYKDVPDNPAYIQIRAQLESANNDRAALEVQMRKLRAQVAGYERKMLSSPQIEREYRELNRDYEGAQLKYREVRAKQMEAQLAQNLETGRKGERFTLIEPPLPPENPVSPNRPAILFIGLILTLALCGGIVALLESVDATVRGRRDLQSAFNMPPLALVPQIFAPGDVKQRSQRLRLTLGATAVACVMALVAVHLFLRPLDVLWFQALRRFGM